MPTTTFDNGIVITTYPIPPAGSSFEKATDQERTVYGLPRFTPGSSDLQKQWEGAIMRGIRLVEPVFKQRDIRTKKLPGFTPGHGTETYDNWSGGVTFPASGDKIMVRQRHLEHSLNPRCRPVLTSGILYTASTSIGIDGDDGSGGHHSKPAAMPT